LHVQLPCLKNQFNNMMGQADRKKNCQCARQPGKKSKEPHGF
jgi:hypothetical protein